MNIGMWLAVSGIGALCGYFYGKYQNFKNQKEYVRYCSNKIKVQDRPDWSAKQITCACCSNSQWIEQSSEEILCNECLKNGCDIGMGEVK